MTLGECVRAEESELISAMSIPELKLACIGFARDTTKTGIYDPIEVLEIAKKYFDWVMDNSAFENQQ